MSSPAMVLDPKPLSEPPVSLQSVFQLGFNTFTLTFTSNSNTILRFQLGFKPLQFSAIRITDSASTDLPEHIDDHIKQTIDDSLGIRVPSKTLEAKLRASQESQLFSDMSTSSEEVCGGE
ncbi:hypothetical protein OROGR_003401 [Orobanche gracilis]